MITKVGLIDLGNMGSALARNALQAGFDHMVYDVCQKPLKDLIRLGAKVGSPPAESEDMETSSAVVDGARADARCGFLGSRNSARHAALRVDSRRKKD
jgi:3-hydroxyisobutyrate dehydrogenase-like beta-hydroxyacid dehydrogenase